MLSRREYSVYQLKTRFRRMAPEEEIETAIQRLIENNAQSDFRFAEMICRARFNSGKGPVKIVHELSQNQVDSVIVETVMAAYQNRWHDLADSVRIRKFGRKPPPSYTEWARQARFLQQRGFGAEYIPEFHES